MPDCTEVMLRRAMGESNAARQREPFLRRAVWEAAVTKYREMFGSQEGTFPATFQVRCGWLAPASASLAVPQ